MSIIESLKNCEGCRKRRNFLKGLFIGIGATLLMPFKAKGQLNCACTFCRNGSYCLCCDPSCDHCAITTRERCCVQVLEFCEGVPTYTAVCCPNGQCPGISNTDTWMDKAARWEVQMSGSEHAILYSSNNALDVMDWLDRHNFHFKTSSGKILKAVSANRTLQ